MAMNNGVIRAADLRRDFDCLHLHNYCLSVGHQTYIAVKYSRLLGFNALSNTAQCR